MHECRNAWLFTTIALLTATWVASAPSVAQAEPFVVLMAPSGDDINDGRTLDSPVLTLNRVQEVISDALPDRDQDVQVRVGPGVYRDQQVVWTFSMPEHTITFMPLFDDKVRPVFDGDGTNGATWFRLNHSSGQPTNLVFHYIRVENYATAIDFHGNRNSEDGHNGSNRIYGSYFRGIGENTTAAVRLVNSRNNQIINNHFINILSSSNCGRLHAIYIAHMSSGNEILRNRFQNSCGDPVRIRDYSNNNIVNDNEFIEVGQNAAYTEWFCDHDTNDRCTKPSAECPSWYNEFRNNDLNQNYAGKRLGVWRFLVKQTVTGCTMPTPTTGCEPPAPDACRLRTSGNQSDG